MASPAEVITSEEVTSQNPTQLQSSRGKTDIAWGRWKQIEEKGKLVNLCIYCDKIIRGGGLIGSNPFGWNKRSSWNM